MIGDEKNEWFQTWFDSPFYHALYQHRDEAEATNFLSNLLQHLNLPEQSNILDLACGKGRHSVVLHSKGNNVTGLDLSFSSINHAKQFETEGLKFHVQDMRTFLLPEKFDCIFNLFTSFGYFEMEEDNSKVLAQVKKHLGPNGFFVLDYFNASLVSKCNVESTEKTEGEFHFSINKKVVGDRIVKEIKVTQGENKYQFTERVQLLDATMLFAMLEKAELKQISTFGDYQLQPFDKEKSERLIIICRHL